MKRIFLLFTFFYISTAIANAPIFCDVDVGLILIGKAYYVPAQIETILSSCDKIKPDDPSVLLLHGLLARKEAEKNRDFKTAIIWLKKAVDVSSTDNLNARYALATTYEWANQPENALLIYQAILNQEPDSRIALMGKAGALKTLKQFSEAERIYQALLLSNRRDVDVLNGLGWLALAQNNLVLAEGFFKQVLEQVPGNQEALSGLAHSQIVPVKLENSPIAQPEPEPLPVVLCQADEGLLLINKINPPLDRIRKILAECDKNTPMLDSNLVLHGLMARQSGDYPKAISWLQKAIKYANTDNVMPALELAVTYEWAKDFKSALAVYERILKKQQQNQVALSGKARVLRFSYQIKESFDTYRQLLQKSPDNPEALTGFGELYLTNYQFKEARNTFQRVLSQDPQNKQVLSDLILLDNATKNILDFSFSNYSVPPEQANGFNLNYFRNLNATDSLNVYATHNNRQIGFNIGTGPTLLPNNSLLLGFQRYIPGNYGWQLSYDARQHDKLPFEHRVYGGFNYFLSQNIEWVNGLRWGGGSPWNNQLLNSGLTFYTNLPVNITVTGFWAYQQIGGYNSSYVLDLSKEYFNHLLYNLGAGYLVEQKSLELHGRLVLPVFKNQAFTAQISHYFFNDSSFITAGWRIYWA